MKKIPNLLLVFCLAQMSASWALDSVLCPGGAIADPLDKKQEESFNTLSAKIKPTACDLKLFSSSMTPNFQYIHDKNYCDQIDVCLGNESAEDKTDAKAIVDENMPKAVLLSLLDNEISKKFEANKAIKNFEDKNKTKVCPVEKVEASCEKEIRNALISVSGSFIGYNTLNKAPLSSESLEDYLGKNLFINKVKNAKIKEPTKDQLKKTCGEKINFAQICKKTDERIKAITLCEKTFNSKGCLDPEQKALASINDSHKDKKEVFLSVEKELCQSFRVVKLEPVRSSFSTYSGSAINPFKINIGYLKNQDDKIRDVLHDSISESLHIANVPLSHSFEYHRVNDFSNIRARPSAPVETKTISSSVVRSNVSEVDSINPGVLPIDLSNSINNFEVKAPEGLTEKVVTQTNIPKVSEAPIETSEIHNDNLVKEMAQANAVIPPISPPISPPDIAANTFDNHPVSNTIANPNGNFGFADPVVEAKNSSIVSRDSSVSKKKVNSKEDNSELSSLKDKIAEMTKTIDELKKKDDGGEKSKEEIALEKEKSLADLKNQLAELEANKRKIDSEKLRAVAAEKERAAIEARRIAKIVQDNQNFARAESYKAEQIANKNEIKEASNNSGNNYEASRAPASIPSNASSQSFNASAQGPILTTAGGQNNAEDNTVYMTAADLKKSPNHLAANASSEEIEKMFKGSNGDFIIIGNTEQLKKVYDQASGKFIYKRFKISLVENEKAKARAKERKTASVADLKREDEKAKRALARYKELKESLKAATK